MPNEKGRDVNVNVTPPRNTGEASGAAIAPPNIGLPQRPVPAMPLSSEEQGDRSIPAAAPVDGPNRSLTDWREQPGRLSGSDR